MKRSGQGAYKVAPQGVGQCGHRRFSTGVASPLLLHACASALRCLSTNGAVGLCTLLTWSGMDDRHGQTGHEMAHHMMLGPFKVTGNRGVFSCILSMCGLTGRSVGLTVKSLLFSVHLAVCKLQWHKAVPACFRSTVKGLTLSITTQNSNTTCAGVFASVSVLSLSLCLPSCCCVVLWVHVCVRKCVVVYLGISWYVPVLSPSRCLQYKIQPTS